jgi:hypothetical protein
MHGLVFAQLYCIKILKSPTHFSPFWIIIMMESVSQIILYKTLNN